MRDEGCGAKKNQSLVAYDITSLAYHQNISGENAKYEDEMGKCLRVMVRFDVLFLNE